MQWLDAIPKAEHTVQALACLPMPIPDYGITPPAMLEVSYPAADGRAGTKVSGLEAVADPSNTAEAGGLFAGLVLT